MRLQNHFKGKVSILLLLVALFASFGFTGIVSAASTKNAILSSAKISFNGGEAMAVQTYNIEGYNYIRVRDITDELGMQVEPIENGLETGIMITTWIDSNSRGKLEKLTQESIEAEVFTAMIYYNGIGTEANMFVLGDRFFFRLIDIQKASDNNYDANAKLNAIKAKGNIAVKGVDETICVKVSWDKSTETVKINTTQTNFRQQFNELRGIANIAPLIGFARFSSDTEQQLHYN